MSTFDLKCLDLAEHFLRDEPCRNKPALYDAHRLSLARHIQSAVEEWFSTPEAEPAARADQSSG